VGLLDDFGLEEGRVVEQALRVGSGRRRDLALLEGLLQSRQALGVAKAAAGVEVAEA